jgi:hypothetical protein
MSLLKKHIKLVEDFYRVYKNLLSTQIKTNITNILEWVNGYDITMKTSVPTQDKIRYMRRGVSLLEQFSKRYVQEREVISDRILKCQFENLKNGSCSKETLKKLKDLSTVYSRFAWDLIGCADNASSMLLYIVKSLQKFLGSEFTQKINKLENQCMEIRVWLLKNS